MGSSATNTEGQITIAKSAESICAIRINGDVRALEVGRTIRRLDALAATGAALPGAHLGKRRRHFALRQGAQTARINLHIDAGSLDKHQGSSIANIAGDCADSPAVCRDGIGVKPPLAAEIDGKAATICMGHGRHLLGVIAGIAHREERIVTATGGSLASQIIGFVGAQDFALFPSPGGVLENNSERTGGFGYFGSILREGHFISPTPDYPRRGRFALLHPMSCIIHTKQQNTRTFCNFFSWRRTSPLTQKSAAPERRPLDCRVRPQGGE